MSDLTIEEDVDVPRSLETTHPILWLAAINRGYHLRQDGHVRCYRMPRHLAMTIDKRLGYLQGGQK